MCLEGNVRDVYNVELRRRMRGAELCRLLGQHGSTRLVVNSPVWYGDQAFEAFNEARTILDCFNSGTRSIIRGI